MIAGRFVSSHRWQLVLVMMAVAVAGVMLAWSTLRPARSEAASETLTNSEVDSIIAAALAQANNEDSLLRRSGVTTLKTKMHIAVVDRNGRLRALYSMEDAWVGSIDIAKAKAYTAAAFSSNENALTTRSIGQLSQPGGALWQIGNSNQPKPGDGPVQARGIIEFPGGLPLYKNGKLVGGIGVSGDGVDQDEDVAEAGSCAFRPPAAIRIDVVTGNAVAYTAAASFTCP